MTGLRERNKSKRRAAILDATVSLLREREFGEVTIEEVAALAEVSPHTVYNLIGPRDELVYALMGRVVRHMATTAPHADAGADDPAEALRALTEHTIDALTEESDAHRALLRAVSGLPRWPANGREPLVIYERAARLLHDAGVLRRGITYRVVARQTILGMYGAMTAWARGQTDERFRDDARLNVAIVLTATTIGHVREQATRDVERLGRGVPLLS